MGLSGTNLHRSRDYLARGPIATRRPGVWNCIDMNTPATSDLTRTFLVILIIAILIVGSVWTLLAFVGALLWASTLVISTWPLMLKVQRLTGGNRGWAAASMTLLMGAIFVVPVTLAASVLLDAAIEGADLLKTVMAQGVPPPPSWLHDIPLIGARASARWQELTAGGAEAAMEALRPYARSTAGWAMTITGGFAMIVVHFVLTVIVVAILYMNGEAAARGILEFAWRIGRERAERSVRLAGQAVRSVALGVIVTAFVQSVIAGIGLVLTGVPHAGLLVAFVFVLCVAQLGPLLVLVPATLWLFVSGHGTLGTVLTLFTIVSAVCDNFLKPILIRRGVDLPLLLIIPGVIGGMLSFGVMGLFIGPVVLAVTYTLLVEWIRNDPSGTH
jgi:predicted PurR-regulated permease PerM